jgi:hypothetical protein
LLAVQAPLQQLAFVLQSSPNALQPHIGGVEEGKHTSLQQSPSTVHGAKSAPQVGPGGF